MVEGEISSVEILRQTGLSRATLNNYIKRGFLPPPRVGRPAPGEKIRATKVGYFPAWVLDRLGEIKALKGAGLTMEEIAAHLASTVPTPAVRREKTVGELGTEEGCSPEGPIPVCVLAARLQEGERVRAALPAEEIIALTHDLEGILAGSFARHEGTCLYLTTTGAAALFMEAQRGNYIERTINCALEIKERMKDLDGFWRTRKAWGLTLALNMGVEAGEEWCRRPAVPGAMPTLAPGETLTRAEGIAACGKDGRILATRGVIGRLPRHLRDRLPYGLKTPGPGGEVFVARYFCRVMDMDLPEGTRERVPTEILSVSLTELLSLEAQ
ncbi:MAG TPA: MerR family transcriptional regulator [Syntrophales bacterium]|nr:MerR family transcriptional regulator [Syntrophales bacterium]